MRPIKDDLHDHARNLFFQTDKTRAEIAEAVGVSEKTIYLWTRAGDWKRLRSSSKLMPSLIVENFYSQIQELNDDIRNREPGKRYPSTQEAEVFRKLTLTAERIKKGHTQGEYAEMIQKFMSWLTPQSEEHLKLFTTYADRFLKARCPEGFAPYDIEYSAIEPPLPKEEHEPNNTSLSFGEGRGEAPLAQEQAPPLFLGEVPEGGRGQLAQDTPPGNNTTSSPSERPGEVEAPPLFLGEVPEGGRGQLAQNTPAHDSNVSLSLGEGRAEASLAPDNQYVPPSRFMENGPGDEVKQEIIDPKQETTGTSLPVTIEKKSEMTGNNSETSYEATTNTSSDIDPEKQEITQEYRKKEITPDPGVEIGYLGIKQKPEPGGTVMIEIQQSDPDIQKFSIGEAIYYVKRNTGNR